MVGADSSEAMDTLRALYKPIIEQSFPTELDPRPKVAVPFFTTDLASAEMIKYAANAFLATKISFINEVANLCELVGADVGEVAYGIGLDERIGPRFLSAGIGWGGSCFPKDVAALRAVAGEYDYEPVLLDAAVAVNERQRKQVIGKLQRELHTLKGKRIALLGLAFKPNTDDLREAPSLNDSPLSGFFGCQGGRLRPRRRRCRRFFWAPADLDEGRLRPLRGLDGGARGGSGYGVGTDSYPRPEEGRLPDEKPASPRGWPQRPGPGEGQGGRHSLQRLRTWLTPG